MHLETPRGPLPLTVGVPDPAQYGDGPFPGVVVLHDISGATADLRRNVDIVANHGYLVAAPDLFSHGRRPLCITRVMRDLLRRRGPAVDDILAARDWLRADPRCTGRVGVVGFCMGGGFAIVTSPDFDASAPFYGFTVGSFDDILDGACPVVASFGRRDPLLPGRADRMKRVLDAKGIPNDVHAYPGVGHSFANQLQVPGGQGMLRVTGFGYDQEATDDAWRRVFAFFADHLGQA